jgi:membrane protein implicated in regulation of membrane protease activity
MLSAYIVCLLAGGILLVASMFGGHDSDADAGGEVDTSVDADGDAEAGASADGHSHHEWMSHLPFLSLRFWTWAATFFGVTGLALSLTGTPAVLTAILSAATGLATGWGASYVLARLTKTEVGVLPEASSHIGCEGKLLLPLIPGERSKVRLRVGGTDVDLVAETDSRDTLSSGSPVWVVGLRGTHVVVEASPVLPEKASDSETDKEKP